MAKIVEVETKEALQRRGRPRRRKPKTTEMEPPEIESASTQPIPANLAEVEMPKSANLADIEPPAYTAWIDDLAKQYCSQCQHNISGECHPPEVGKCPAAEAKLKRMAGTPGARPPVHDEPNEREIEDFTALARAAQALSEEPPGDDAAAPTRLDYIRRMREAEVPFGMYASRFKVRIGKQLIALRIDPALNRRWEAYVNENCPFSIRCARNYIAIAMSYTEEEAAGRNVTDMYEELAGSDDHLISQVERALGKISAMHDRISKLIADIRKQFGKYVTDATSPPKCKSLPLMQILDTAFDAEIGFLHGHAKQCDETATDVAAFKKRIFAGVELTSPQTACIPNSEGHGESNANEPETTAAT